MNIYQLSFGHLKHLVVAKDEKEAYKIGTDPEKFPDLHFRPFQTDLIEVEGYTITLAKNDEEPENEFSSLNVDELKAWLDEREIKYHWNSGEDKLRELALSNV